MTQRPDRRKLRGISPIWILPVIALIICASLLWTSWKNAGIEVTLLLNSASGITAGKTQVMIHGIPVGKVESISPDIRKSKVILTLKMDAQMKEALVEDTIFWVVRPQLSASSVSGLETIFSGSYINVQPGASEVSRRSFTATDEQPPPPENTPGLHLTLQAETLGSIQPGSDIYFRNIPIGSVEQTQLDEDSPVLIKVIIQPRYSHLVRKGSRFCNASGINVQGSLSSVQVHMESVAALLRGGIQLFTPDAEKKSPPAENGASYKLYKNYAAAEYGLPLELILTSSEGIVEGVTKVMFRGLESGVVKSVEFRESNGSPEIIAHVLLDPRAERILREETVFWMVKPEIGPSGVKNISRLLSGSYITFQVGGGAFRNTFPLRPDAPPQRPLRPGRSLLLTSTEAAQVAPRSPVFFKNIQVGEVVAVHLHEDGNTLNTEIFLYEEYFHLVNSSSIFWLQSGINVKADLKNGLTVDTGPLTSMLFGGIRFATPQQDKPLAEKETLPLYSSYGKAAAVTPSLQREGRLIAITADNGASLHSGMPILYKNIEIGEVHDFHLNKKEKIDIDALIYQEFSHLVTDSSRFFSAGGVEVNAGLDGIKLRSGSLLSIAAGGISMINIDGAALSRGNHDLGERSRDRTQRSQRPEGDALWPPPRHPPRKGQICRQLSRPRQGPSRRPRQRRGARSGP